MDQNLASPVGFSCSKKKNVQAHIKFASGHLICVREDLGEKAMIRFGLIQFSFIYTAPNHNNSRLNTFYIVV